MNPTSLSLEPLLAVVNRVLQMDPELRGLLSPLVGRVLAIELEGVELPLRITFSERALELADPEAVADATVRAKATALASLAMRRGRGNTGAVEFRGDVAVVHGVRRLLNELEIDWEEQLSQFTGDIVAHQVGNFFRGTWDWLERSRRTLEQNMGEYLTEEVRQLPAEAEVSGFLSDIDRLRQDMDRLQARIARLEKLGRGRG